MEEKMQKDDIFKRNIEYPGEIHIETTTFCNAKCTFCIHSTMKRRNRKMTDILFEKIINDLKEIPTEHAFTVTPFKIGELLMDKSIFEKIKRINEELPNAWIRLFSNFNMLTEEHIIKIGEIKNLGDVTISLNSLNPEEYYRIMGLDLSRTLENMMKLLDAFANGTIKPLIKKLIISSVRIGTDEENMLHHLLQKTLFESKEFAQYSEFITLQNASSVNWIGDNSQNGVNLVDSCERWVEISITCDGEVAFCCRDGNCSKSIGNLTKNSILEIYNMPMRRKLRTEAISRGEIDPCKFCTG